MPEEFLKLAQVQLPKASGGKVPRRTERPLPSRAAPGALEAKGDQLGPPHGQDLVGESVEVPGLPDRRDRLDERAGPAVAGADQAQDAGGVGRQVVGAKVAERVVDGALADPPARQDLA